MHRLYTETNVYNMERQRSLLGEQQRERTSLSDGQQFSKTDWIHAVSQWLVAQLARLGQRMPCIDNDLACDMQFVA